MNTNKDIIIVGFSGFGKEVYWLASRLGIPVHGFLDDNETVHGESFHSAQVLGGVDDWQKYSNCQFIIAVGNPRVRHKIKERMCNSGSPEFAILIDPLAVIAREFVKIGSGSIICAGTIATVEVVIGEHVIINLNCTIGHEVVLGDFATVAPMVAISGNVQVGSRVEIGTGAAILQGLKIHAGAMIGMGSVLTKHVPENTVFFGCPAKAIKTIAQ